MEKFIIIYTHMNLCAVFLFPWMSKSVQDVIRASTFLILVAVATVWLSGNLIEVYHDLIDSFIPYGDTLSNSVKTGMMIVYDALFHVVPCLILGLPYHVHSLFIAYGILVSWFVLMRHKLPSIYSPKVSFDRGIVVAGIVALVVAVWLSWER
jgi:hypothetical protein